jgi:parallel beta-helix repeat protein
MNNLGGEIMKGRLAAIVCFVFMVGMNSQAMSAAYYVSQTGSDSNSGTVSAPFRTITYAYSRVVAGDTINVEPGTYTDYSTGWGIYLNKSGSAGQQITLHSTVRGGAIIDGSASTNRPSCFYLYGTSYNTIDGFTIRNCAQGGISIYNNGSVNSTNNQFTNNEIYNIAGPNTGRTGQGGQGIQESTVGGTCNNLVAQNYIHDIGSAWDDTFDHGLYMDCGGNTYVNNILANNTHGSGLQLADYYPASNVRVYNNAMINNETYGIVIWTSGGLFTNLTVDNNISYGNRRGFAGCAAVGTGIVLSNNISYNNSVANYTQDACGGGSAAFNNTNMIQSDPLFVGGPAPTSYEVSSGSPAIGAGISSLMVTIDYADNPRPSTGVTIGAYQYNSAYRPPPSSATFVKFDTTTKGSWSGVYGADGYVISQDSNITIPTYAQVSSAGVSNYIWNSSTTDVRALQRPENRSADGVHGHDGPENLSNRIAACWFSWGSLSISTNLSDGNPHQIALYLLDWDSTARAETITVTDATTGAILDTRVFRTGSFTYGEYAVWTVTGNVNFQVTRNSGANAVVSGIFFH